MIFLFITALVLLLIWLPPVSKDRERTIRLADLWLCCVCLGMFLLISVIILQMLARIIVIPSQT